MTDPEATEQARILIVDDEPFNVDLLEQELEDRGFITMKAYGGREALEKVRADPPDLILLDVVMPDIDGITVCRMLKEDPQTHLIPIVIMTALNALEDRIRGIEAGADDFLSKPVDDRELLARIRTALKAKRVVDKTVEALRSAEVQLDRLGSHQEDLSILVVELEMESQQPDAIPIEAQKFLLERYQDAYIDVLTMFSGEVCEITEGQIIAVIRSPDPDSHPQLALEAALALQAETKALNQNSINLTITLTIGIASGPVMLGSTRFEQDGGAVWALKVEGAAYDQAIQLAGQAARGEISLSQNIPSKRGGEIPDQTDGEEPAEIQEQVSIEQGSLLWPSEYNDLREKTYQNWGIQDIYLHRVLSGKSGALVYAVDITSHEYSGQAILKLSDIEDQGGGEEDEVTRHRHAIEENPGFAQRHLPEIVAELEHKSKSVVLVTIAARGLEYAMPWVHCDYDVQFKTAHQLSKGILEDWNESYALADGIISPSELLLDWLSYRLNQNLGGRIHDFLQTEGGIDPIAPTFICEGHWYPNPLTFAIQPMAGAQKILRAVTGVSHGDLHGYNVLIGDDNGSVSYYLIDLAFYRKRSFLFFDHAYFELSHLLQRRGDSNIRDWLSLVRALEKSAPQVMEDVGLIHLLSAVRSEVSDWINRHEPNRLSYMESQFMLARVAVGLNFTHKRIQLEAKTRAFLYAAECLKSYLKFHKVDWPKNGEVFRAGGREATHR